MSAEEPIACYGRSAHGGCGARVRYAVERPAGPGKVSVRHACGRHLSWVIDYVSIPGSTLTVVRLPA